MNLFIKISKEDLANYRKEFIECLTHNSSNSYIKNIFIYTDDIDHKIQSFDKIKVYFKRSLPTDSQIVDYSKSFKENKIIFSSSFIKFEEDLYKVTDGDLENFVITGNGYYIYSINTNSVNKGRTLEFTKKEKSLQLKTSIITSSLNIEKRENNPQVLVKKSVYRPPQILPTKRDKKLDVIIVSVDYNDYLSITLFNNIKLFKNITVVTSPNDLECKEICKRYDIKCIITDVMYEDGAIFNKGKAINAGIKSLENPDLILLLDADIIVERQIDLDILSDEILYTSERIILLNYNSYQDYIENGQNKRTKLENDKGYGFFQLFCINNTFIDKDKPFPENSKDASYSDLEFRDKFNNRKTINHTCLHLGEPFRNWKGRLTEKFITDDLQSKIIDENSYKIAQIKYLCSRPDEVVINSIELDRQFNISNIINNYNRPISQNDLSFDIEIIQKSNYNIGKKILFLINLNDIGGAEYVSYQHIKMCKELGYNPVVLSSGKGMFFNKIKDLEVDLYYSKLYELDKDKIINILFNISKECEIIYNCNYFAITPYIKTLKKIRKFEYLSIAHSDIEWVIDSLYDYDEITDKYIVIHDKIRNEFNKKGVINTKIFTIPNYIDTSKVDVFFQRSIKSKREELGIKSSDFVVGMITRISEDKNIIDAIKIINRCKKKDLKLLIVGDSTNTTESIEYKERVLKLINDCNLQNNVIITGHVNNDDIYEFISCFDVAINTSPSEGLPISLLEAMSIGIYCIYPSHGEIPDLLTGYGTVINIKQKKSFNKSDHRNYIFSNYTDEELLPFVKEIDKMYNKETTINKQKIIEYIKLTRSSESIKYYLDFIFGGYKKGLSFVIRARNEEKNILRCLSEISDIADEIVFVDHLSTDKTFEIAYEMSKNKTNIKVFRYKNEIVKPGKNYKKNVNTLTDGISNYYNFCLSKVTKNNFVKWDADFLPIRENLIDMINNLDLRERIDKFSLWFSGKTLFINQKEFFVNEDSYYDEFRSFSIKNGAKWEDALKCEYISPQYISESIELRYENPCFYEIKRTDTNEFQFRDGLIDKRDLEDYNIINNLKIGNEIPKLKKIKLK